MKHPNIAKLRLRTYTFGNQHRLMVGADELEEILTKYQTAKGDFFIPNPQPVTEEEINNFIINIEDNYIAPYVVELLKRIRDCGYKGSGK